MASIRRLAAVTASKGGRRLAALAECAQGWARAPSPETSHWAERASRPAGCHEQASSPPTAAAAASPPVCRAGGAADVHLSASSSCQPWFGASARGRCQGPNTAPSGRRRFHTTRPAGARRDFYEVLGVPRSASAAEIKKAYYELAKQYHPDSGTAAADEDKFQEVQAAYEVLKDEEKRRTYDQLGAAGWDATNGGQAGAGPGAGFEDFSSFFRGGRSGGAGVSMDDLFGMFGQGRASQDLTMTVQLPLTFMEAVQGTSKEFSYMAPQSCGTCNGTGAKTAETCRVCGGNGQVHTREGFFHMSHTCNACGGSGAVIKELCKDCQGQGVVERRRSIRVKVPEGATDGMLIRIPQRGATTGRGQVGDLVVKLQVAPDAYFRRKGADVHVTVPVDLGLAIFGGSAHVRTLTGAADLRVPPGSQSESTFVMRGKGIKRPPSSPSPGYGDQYVHLKVKIPNPRELSDRQQRLLRQVLRPDDGGREDDADTDADGDAEHSRPAAAQASTL